MEEFENATLVVACKSLSIGTHRFDFQLDDNFFSLYENTDIQHAQVSVGVEVRKMAPAQFGVSMGIEGTVEVMCDRCLEPLTLPVAAHADLEEKEVEELLHMPECELVLDQYVYDTVCVNLPLQRMHKEGECNPEMIKIWEANQGHKAQEAGAFEALKDMIDKED